MKRKVIYIAFSDIQIEDWKQFSIKHSRLEHNGNILQKIYSAAKIHKCPVLFGGDLYDNNNGLSNLVLNESFKWFNRFKKKGIKILAISGNHDQSEKNTLSNKSPSYIDMMATIYSNFTCLDNAYLRENGYIVAGVPYYSSPDDFLKSLRVISKNMEQHREKKILLIHTHLPGASEPSGFKLDSDLPKNIYKELKQFDLVLSGHIHKPQELSSNVINMGATHHQRSSDTGCTMGYYLIYNDLSTKFVPLNIPEFVYIKDEAEAKNDYDFYILVEEAQEEGEGEEVSNNFKPNALPKTLAKEYLKAKNIKSKYKLKTLQKYLKL